MNDVRRAVVAGLFYPDEPRDLRNTVDELLQAARLVKGTPPLAMIQPHAGYVYSGPVAATGYRRLHSTRPRVDHVVVLGPNHTVALDRIAVTTASAWDTPLGRIGITDSLRTALLENGAVEADDRPHLTEHAIEVQLPFLQRVLEPGWDLLPLVVGDVSPAAVAEVIDTCWGSGTLTIVSTDLSHYHSYSEARSIDELTVGAITTRSVDVINPRRACGAMPLRGLLVSPHTAGLETQVLDVRNSGDTAGDRRRVVGYVSVVFGDATSPT